ncbi:hypothetical protein [Sporosarcina sp. SAFN-010]|uniref:hypothetical protein n=1 Tax=Sporosarcina sp. SAFN-010 TaxID=3387273 RepID=UPI003F80848D
MFNGIGITWSGIGIIGRRIGRMNRTIGKTRELIGIKTQFNCFKGFIGWLFQLDQVSGGVYDHFSGIYEHFT